MASQSVFDSDTFIPLPENPTHYAKVFQTFLDHSNYRLSVNDWYENVLPDFVVNKFAPKPSSSSSSLRMLGVGSGPGDIDLKLALGIQSRFKKVHNTVVEPAEDHNAFYRQLLDETTIEGVRNIEYDFRQQRIEDYRQDDANKGKKFDFISAMHSLYHMDDYDDIIGYLYDCLEGGGILMINMCIETSSYSLVQKHFPQTQLKGMQMITSSDVERSFEERGIPHQTSRIPYQMDVAKFLEESLQENPSPESDLIFDFMSMAVDTRKQAPKFYRELINFLKSDPHCVKRGEGGKLIFDCDSDIVIVQKRSG